MKMKTFLILLVSLTLLFSGCSGIQAAPEMTKVIKHNAEVAQVRLNTEQTLETAKAGVASNSLIFSDYHSKATVNVFAYWFDPEKQIYCNATYYSLLNKCDVAGKIILKNADTYDESALKELYTEENKWLLQTNDGLVGSEIQR